ncbi:hypothetical protein FRC02_011982 [Tulasnella sp. 418]|nr:hypothetical protein FRC02_011982 [Tulasnella sp. 418]
MAKEPSDIEKPPLPFKGARLSKSRPLPLIPVAEGSSSTQPKDTKRESHLLVKARDTAENNQQPKGDTDPPVHDSGTSTPIIRRSSRVDNMSSEIPPPPEYGPYNADYDYHPSLGVMSHDKHLNEDGEALYRFLIEHGTVPPKMHLRIEGTHKEEVEVRGGSSSADDKETTIITVRDFFFVIELSPYILNDPVWWSESDDTPAFRGAMNMQIEPNGPVPPLSRVGVSREERKAQEAWEKE